MVSKPKHVFANRLAQIHSISYDAEILKKSEEELLEMERKSTRFLTVNGACHSCADTIREESK